MDSIGHNKTLIQPKTFAELLPELRGILTEDAIHTFSVRKQSRKTKVMLNTAEKNLKPRTMAEMQANIQALQVPSVKRPTTQISAMKKKWNSSIKVDQKKTHHTGNGQQAKHAAVRKVLNFLPKPKIPASRVTMISAATPTFVVPELRAKKTQQPVQGQNNIRISGVYNIPETPMMYNTKKHPVSRFTLVKKDNVQTDMNINKKIVTSTITVNNRPLKCRPPVLDTPLSNVSSDASFLLKEKEINDIEQKNDQLIEATLENIAEVSPPVSTPFKDYRSVHEFFNDSSQMDNSVAYKDNTITCLDNPSICINGKREESVIVSLCDLLSKATVAGPQEKCTNANKEPNDLVEMEKEILNNIKLIENGIAMMNKIKHTQETTLQNLRKLISDAKSGRKMEKQDGNFVLEEREITTDIVKDETSLCSVIKSTSKSPSYKIPRKSMCLRKKVFCKSMPSSLDVQTPEVKLGNGRALSEYLNLKETMNFLNTPKAKRRLEPAIPDTPAVTSHNLQKQLSNLYNDS